MRVAILAAAAAVLLAAGCERQDPTATPEGVVQAAYEAIKSNNWDEYEKLTVTTADFILKEYNAQSPMKQQMSYVGTQLKPEEQQRQRKDFQRAVAGGPDALDIRNATFGKAHLAASGDEELLNGSVIPVTAYLVALEGQSAPSQQPPGFVVVKWGSFYKILRLSYPGAGVEDAEEG